MAGFSFSVLSRAASGLSARLLVLTVLFVLLGEIFIYVPSIARHRMVFLEERIEAARIAALAVEASPDGMVTEELRLALLDRAGVAAVSLKRPGSRRLVLADDMPVTVDASFDLREATPLRLIAHAADTLRHGGERTIRVMGVAPGDSSDTMVDIVLPETPMFASMLDYSGRILVLSIILAFVVAGLVYLSLHWLMVLPLGRMTDSLVSFRRAPEDAAATVRVSGRRDEIGLAQRELQVMQRRVRAALRQRARLAALGTGVTKINHDLRNMLATAAVLTDRLAMARDPEVQKLAHPLVAAIDRAITLCTHTLSFATGRLPAPRRTSFALAPLVDDVGAALSIDENSVIWRNDVPPELQVTADRDQLYRVIINLAQNAAQALACRDGGGTLRIDAWDDAGGTVVEVADTGPGIPAPVREHLFEAFADGGGSEGTGLGLAIARELMRNHGGDIDLERSDHEGTVFRLRLPDVPDRETTDTPDE
ncbi:MAG: HAMP domain-containing sensor histidine kinase [Rhodospirillales bacterium]|nr:HAMP domain-containing sensor histidine kinase [Rhodospirillales bacterium]